MYRILIVEDDPVITETLCAYMGRWGMEARGIEDFQSVLREFAVGASNIGYTSTPERKSREGWRFAKQIRPDLD